MNTIALILAATLQLPAQKSDAVIGVAALHLEKGSRIEVRANERFPMGSVYKFPIAIAVLHRVDRGTLQLDQKITIEPKDFAPGWSPIRERAHGKAVTYTLRELLREMVAVSDNTACDVLLQLAGGGPAVTLRLRQLGVTGLRIDRLEREMAADLKKPGGVDAYARDVRDTSTPNEMLELLARFWRGEDGLSKESHAMLVDWMSHSITGARRIKAALPPGATVAHKTGTMPGTANDVGVITTANGEHVAIVVFTKARKNASERNAEDDIAAIVRAVLSAP